MAFLAYLFYIFTAFAGAILIYYFFNRQKKGSRFGNAPSFRYNFVRRVLPLDKSNWELTSLDHGLRVWKKSDHASLFAASTILPASLKVVKEVLTNSSLIIEWNPWIKTVSRINVSNCKEDSSSKHSGDVISVTETSCATFSLLGVFDGLMKLFNDNSKLYARTWCFDEDIQFWLHSALVEPQLTDPLFTLFMAFPIKDQNEKCQLIVASQPQSGFNPNILSTSLAGLHDLIVHMQSEVVLPEIKIEEGRQNSMVIDPEECVDDENSIENDLEETQEIDSLNTESEACSEDFVDITGVYYSPEKDSQKYKSVVDNGLKKLMEAYSAKDKENGWGLVGIIKGVEIMKKPASPGFSDWDCSKGTIEINVPMHYLLAYLEDMKRTSDYDDMYERGQVVESLGDLTKITYMEYKGIWPISGRDFCSVSATRILPNGILTYFAKWTKHASCPPCKKYVRGKILCGGFVFKILQEDPPRILTTYITHVDLMGSVPSRIVNKVTANQPASVGIVKRIAEKLYKDDLANPDKPSKYRTDVEQMKERLARAGEISMNTRQSEKLEVPATQPAPLVPAVNGDLTQTSRDTRQQTNDTNQPSYGTMQPSNGTTQLSNGTSSLSLSPSIHASPFEFGGMDYKTIGNQACAGLLQEAFEVSEVDISTPSGPSVCEQWQYQETEKKVLLFRKIHEHEKMHSFIGKGIIACSPPKIWEILKDPENAYRYNNMLKETRTLEILNDRQRIEYLHFQAEKCFRKEARDFIVLKTGRKEKDKYLMSYVSVDYQNSPSKKDVKRGKIIASGWVIEPLLHDGQLYSMVTYLAQVNPGGSYPAALVNLTGRKQPLCLAYLRRMIENPNQSLTNSESSEINASS